MLTFKKVSIYYNFQPSDLSTSACKLISIFLSDTSPNALYTYYIFTFEIQLYNLTIIRCSISCRNDLNSILHIGNRLYVAMIQVLFIAVFLILYIRNEFSYLIFTYNQYVFTFVENYFFFISLKYHRLYSIFLFVIRIYFII